MSTDEQRSCLVVRKGASAFNSNACPFHKACWQPSENFTRYYQHFQCTFQELTCFLSYIPAMPIITLSVLFMNLTLLPHPCLGQPCCQILIWISLLKQGARRGFPLRCRSLETPLLHMAAHEFPLGRLHRWMLNQTERLWPICEKCCAHKNTTSTLVVLQKTLTLLRCLQAFILPLMPGKSSGVDPNIWQDTIG